MFWPVLCLARKCFIFLPISELALTTELDDLLLLTKILARSYLSRSESEICNVNAFHGWRNTFSAYLLFPSNRKLPKHQKKIYVTHNKENNIRNTVRVCMFQKLLGNKHLRLRDSRLSLVRPSGDLGLSTRKKINKARANLEPRSAHGRAVNKNKSKVNLEPRSAHGRAVNKNKKDYEPRSAHGRAVKKKNICLYLHATRAKQLLPALTIVNVRTISNQNIVVSSKKFPLIESTSCEKQKYQVTFVTINKIFRFIFTQLAHALVQTSKLISSITKPNRQKMSK